MARETSAQRPAYVIGSGPNGLTAAILLARAGLKVTVLEAQESIGGGTRSAALTLPGFVHDICSAVHPLAAGSPVFQTFPLKEHGLEFIQPPVPLAHPLDDGSAVLLERSLDATAANLGEDGAAYRRVVGPLAKRWPEFVQDLLAPAGVPHSPLLFARFAMVSGLPATLVARTLFRGVRARALFAGCAAHSILPLEWLGTSAFGWVLAIAAHGVGWPVAKGGSQKIADALASYFQSLGGTIQCNSRVNSLDELRDAGLVLGDITPRELLRIAGSRLPSGYARKLERFRYGPGAFKVDWALSAPIPWRAADCAKAGTVHIGGSIEEIAESERAPWENRTAAKPFVLLSQPSLFDSSRAPSGNHTAWAYCHVANGSQADMLDAIENQIERFAPGFRSVILARTVRTPADLERYNANLVGGDVNSGALTIDQLFLRPTRQLYKTPLAGVYLCSSSTPPGGGVHGMCGYHAATRALAGLPGA